MSLRSRLTLSYASLAAVVLILVAMVLTRFAFAFLTQPTFAAVETSVRDAEAVVAAHPNEPAARLVKLVERVAVRPGVVVLAPHGDAPRRPPPNDFGQGMFRMSVGSVLGLRPRFVRLSDQTAIFIAPDLHAIAPLVKVYVESLALSVLLAIAVAWLVGRWITAQAIAPLITVTGELRRFAQGDFTQRTVATSDRSELGALIAAYNGATAQVSAAFAERASIEAHMRRFLADAGHELRTPLTVISGFIDVLERGGLEDHGIRERAFPTLRIETRRMRRLVERLMALARMERPEAVRPEAVNLTEIAQDAVDEVMAARNTDVELRVHAGDTWVLGDRGDLHEAINNLVDNAVKYGEGSAVTVDVGCEGRDVTVRVRDRGPGISDADRPHLFERFFRGAQAATVEGSGLGLAIVERAVTRYGGSIRLESDDAAETTFVLALPAKRARTRDEAVRVG